MLTCTQESATWHDMSAAVFSGFESEPSLFMVLRARELEFTEASKQSAKQLSDARAAHTSDSEHEWLDDSFVVLKDLSIDLEDGSCLNKWSMFVVDENKKLIGIATGSSIDTSDARHWHTPSNEREFNRSPQRALWQTAKELKWSQYIELRACSSGSLLIRLTFASAWCTWGPFVWRNSWRRACL